jgi:hypothetical protein
VKLASALSTFGKSAALSLGSSAAARSLLADLGSEDENVRTLAGMFLVRNGRRALPVLRQALARREQLPTLLTILGDIAAPESEAEIARYTDDDEPEVAQAAELALDAWRRNRARQG